MAELEALDFFSEVEVSSEGEMPSKTEDLSGSACAQVVRGAWTSVNGKTMEIYR